MKDPNVIAFCRKSVFDRLDKCTEDFFKSPTFNRLETSMSTIDELTKKRDEKSLAVTQAEKDEVARKRARYLIAAPGDALDKAMEQVYCNIKKAGKEGLLSAALLDGDILTIGSLVAKAVFINLLEQVENE